MYRVSRVFDIINRCKPKEEIEGLFVGEVVKHAIMATKRHCVYVKDYGTRENYEKNFELFDEDFMNVLLKIYPEKRKIEDFEFLQVKVNLNDEPAEESKENIKEEEPMTFRKWSESRKNN